MRWQSHPARANLTTFSFFVCGPGRLLDEVFCIWGEKIGVKLKVAFVDTVINEPRCDGNIPNVIGD